MPRDPITIIVGVRTRRYPQSSGRRTGRADRPLILIPAFNEAANIEAVLARIHQATPAHPVLIVDDGSTDDTAARARTAGAGVIRLPFNLGYGVALQTGYKYALRHGHDCVVQLDADGQHEPGDIPALLAPIAAAEADVVVGSRFMVPGGYRSGAVRRLGMVVFGALAFWLTGRRFSDVTSGFQALGADVLRFFSDDRYPPDYPDADVLIMLNRAGFRIHELPVRMYARHGGRSQHAGLLRPAYYVFKMLLSVLLTPLRQEAFKRQGA